MKNQMQSIRQMPDKCDYLLFKEGVSPTWEAPEHKGQFGGEIRFNVPSECDPDHLFKYCVGHVIIISLLFIS